MSDVYSQSTLVRLYVDGELEGQPLKTFESQLQESAELSRQVELEREIRRRVAGVLSHPRSAPAGLAERIRAALEDDRPRAAEPPAIAAPVAAPASASAPDHDRSDYRFPSGVNVLAVAACLALVAGAVLFGIFGSPIDTIVAPPPSGLVAKAADHMSAEHERTQRDPVARQTKAALRDPARVMQDCREYLGRTVPRIDLSSLGYTMLGSGHCHVPGHTCSVHLIFERPTPRGDLVTASVFLAPNEGQFPLAFGKNIASPIWTRCEGARAVYDVHGTTDGATVFFVVCSEERDLAPIAEAIMGAIQSTP